MKRTIFVIHCYIAGLLLFFSESLAQDAAPPGPNAAQFIQQTVFFALMGIFAVWWIVLRPENARHKKQQEFVSSLKKGTKVITDGGIIGTVCNIDKVVTTIEISPKIKVKVKTNFLKAFDTSEAGEQAEQNKDEGGK